MSDKPGEHSGRPSSGRSPIVFVSDSSAEAERAGDTLRAAGYVVADVPISLLHARIVVQKPNVVLLDVDGTGVLTEIAKLRKLPGAGAIDFIFIGSGGGAVKNVDDALANEGSAFFPRPIDVAAIVRKLEALTGGPALRPDVRPSTPPPSLPPARPSTPSPMPPPSLPAPGLRSQGPPLPMSTPSLADLVDPPRSLAMFGTVSHELQHLLHEAELRAETMSAPDAPLPTPEEEIEAVLPADVLASLDEPLEGDEDDDAPDGAPRLHETQPGREGAHAKGTTAGGSRHPTTGSGGRPATGATGGSSRPAGSAGTTGSGGTGGHDRRVSSDAPPRTTASAEPPANASSHVSRRASEPWPPADDARSAPPRSDLPPIPSRGSWLPPATIDVAFEPRSRPTPLPARGPSVQPAAASAGVVLTGADAARRFFADAVARRATGSLCFDEGGVVRRVVLRDGDLVAAASSDEHESLAQFLGARGELPREEVARLSEKVPPYGRHAGAALVAHGWLRQDQLWTVLRAHAEWIASAILRIERGAAQLEPEPPGRLRNEPSVFGAATGAETFVDLVRRAIAPEEALERVGGQESRVADGSNQGLLAECHLPPQDLELISRGRGGSIADLLARSPDAEIVAVVYALALLGVVEVVPAPDFGRAPGRSADPEIAALDEEAIRSRIRARLELVEEGDYFAVLGVSRDATGYEIRRAFIDLRRTYEPSRILTPRLVDLTDDVKKIAAVLDESYEILRDPARRERYRRAIEARPE